MSDASNIANDVLIDVSGLSLAELPDDGDSILLRALRRFLAVEDETDVIAEWSSGLAAWTGALAPTV